MKNILTILFFFSGFATGLHAQPGFAELNLQFFHAYIASDLAQWQSGIERLEKALEADPENDRLRYRLAHAAYGAVGACLATDDEKSADRLLDLAEKHLKKLLKKDDGVAEYHALMAGVYGLQIALSPMKGMFLGPKSSRHVDRALSLDPACADAHFQQGASLLNTPAMWGGDAEAGAAALEQACRLYEQTGDSHSWPYLNALAMLGQAYQELGRKDAARDTYHKALAIAPEFSWVKYVLLPEVAARDNR